MALHYAVNKGHTQLIEFLILKGTEIDARDKNGEMTLCETCCRGLEPVVTLLTNIEAAMNGFSMGYRGWGR